MARREWAVEEAPVYAERDKGRVLLDALGRERRNVDELLPEEPRTMREALVRDLGAVNPSKRRLFGLDAREPHSPPPPPTG